MVSVESSSKIYDGLSSSINKASTEIIVVTPKLDQELAESLLSRSASGVNVRLITSDRVWSKWLENSRASYRVADEKKIEQNLQELEHNMSLFSRLPYIIAVILYAISSIAFLRVGYIISVSLFVISTAVFLFSFYFIRIKKLKDVSNQYNISKESLNSFHEQSKSIREEIAKHLRIDESREIGFSVVCSDSECYLTSMPLTRSKEDQYHFFYKVNYEEVISLISQISIAQ
ncbi:hypothetical protein [Sulfuracidifex tepidarius]|uniref:Uncharacterized protein n=1 Tax=Sulfuracidifex tepidarius TaxID=1294262 RepID=A0A510DZ66_9CREN|nr:hypothetical protein [Sulfuracidifex tepidarius]BBG22746.1 hypothetical protein IC006_0030 [Sulfuracidifex tepidarius]BBG25525.1 hypothetical protein IC007_0030 [Sulfuracidifex tepidarius]